MNTKDAATAARVEPIVSLPFVPFGPDDNRPIMHPHTEEALKLHLTWLHEAEQVMKSDPSRANVLLAVAKQLATAIPFREEIEGCRTSKPLHQSLPFLSVWTKERIGIDL